MSRQEPKALKSAVGYLRVSTKQQAVRDGNPEGYSLPTQRAEINREATNRKSTRLNSSHT